jgi:histidinol dehydrogenase
MMDKVQQSLQDNMEHILANLPKEFHESCKKEIAAACESPLMSDEEEAATILEALSPEHAEAFKQNPTAHKSAPKSSLEEQKAAVLDALDSDEHKKQFEENWQSQLIG